MNLRPILLTVWTVFVNPPVSQAEPHARGLNGSATELEQVQTRIRAVQMALQALDTEKNSLVAQLAGIERQYGDLVKTLRGLEAEALDGARRLAATARQEQQLRGNIMQQNQTLAGQARAAYAAGRQEWLKLVLNQEDPARFSRVLTYYGYLNRARFSQLQVLKLELAQARKLQEQLASESERLGITRTRLKSEQARLAELKKERRAVLAKLELDSRDKSGQLKALQEDERRLQSLIVSLQRATADVAVEPPHPIRTSPQSRGQIGWPVKGPVLASFGAPRMSGRWDGVLIGAPEGTPVQAVSPGRVAFADWLRGYGLLTIIDHGDGYMSLYAFNQSLHKNVGDWVETGETIASVGTSGGQHEPGLYFGVREKGRPIDPLSWCERVN